MVVLDLSDVPESVRSAFGVDELTDILAGLNAKALRVAPCLSGDPTTEQIAEARLLLLGTLKRWAEAGSGALTQRTQAAGPFNHSESYDTRQRTGYNLWPSEISELQAICLSGSESDGAYMVDMTGADQSSELASRPDLWFQWVQPTPHDAP